MKRLPVPTSYVVPPLGGCVPASDVSVTLDRAATASTPNRLKPGLHTLIRRASVALVALLLCRPETAQACAVCFGKSDSAMAKGMNMGIFTLLFFITATLAALSCFFVFLAMRSARVSGRNAAQPPESIPSNHAPS